MSHAIKFSIQKSKWQEGKVFRAVLCKRTNKNFIPDMKGFERTDCDPYVKSKTNRWYQLFHQSQNLAVMW